MRSVQIKPHIFVSNKEYSIWSLHSFNTDHPPSSLFHITTRFYTLQNSFSKPIKWRTWNNSPRWFITSNYHVNINIYNCTTNYRRCINPSANIRKYLRPYMLTQFRCIRINLRAEEPLYPIPTPLLCAHSTRFAAIFASRRISVGIFIH